MPLRKLGIGTYVTVQPLSPDTERPEGYNPFHPIATATLDTTVFDVVHMFSEGGISAVPIVDEDGIVVNLYETVDVIVSYTLFPNFQFSYRWLVETRLNANTRLSCGLAPTNLWT